MPDIIGYLLKYKGIQYAMEALAKLIEKYDIGAELSIIGEGSYEKELNKLAEKLEKNQYIKWKGFITREKLL